MQVGVLWDWDEVVIDSSKQHEASWERLAEEIGKPLPEDHFVRGFGKKNHVIIPHILNWSHDSEEVNRLGNRKEAIYRDIIVREGCPPELIPGVIPFLKQLHGEGIPSVVATSTERENVYAIFELLGMEDLFSGMVASEDVSHGKPHPEVFLKAAAVAERDPRHCVVFEDSIHGIEAGLAGGMKVVGVASTQSESRLKSAGVDAIIPHYLEQDLTLIHGLFAATA